MKTDRWQTPSVSGSSPLHRFIGALCFFFVAFASGRSGAQLPADEGQADSTGLEAAEEPVEEPEPVEETTDSADAAALSYFRDARDLYDHGSYREALVQFRASYALSRRAVLFYNYSLCYQRLHEYADAVEFLERYLLEVVNIPNRADLEVRLRRMQVAAENDERGTADRADSHAAAWVAFGVGAAGGLAALVAGPMALSERSRLDEQPCALTSTCDASTLRRRALIADVGIGVAATGAVLGVILWFVMQSDDGDEEASLRIDPSFVFDGRDAQAGAQLVGHF